MNVDIIGYVAVVIGAISIGPQIYKILKTKKVRDINFLFFFMRALSSVLYIIYGLLKKDYVIFSSAIMPLVLEICVYFYIFIYKSGEESNNS